MKVVLAGAFGNLGIEILKALTAAGHEVVAADMVVDGAKEIVCERRVMDATRPETLKGLCDGANAVISTVGLTRTSATITNYQVDYQGNLNLLEEAKRAGVQRFVYISVIKADSDPAVPMLHAKALFEEKLKASGLTWVIHRPTGYFYDIAKVFMPMIEKGQVTLLGKQDVHANVIDTPDFADFIVRHLEDENCTYDVGGRETYSYEEMAKMFFAAAGKPAVIKRAPVFLFDVLALVNRWKRTARKPLFGSPNGRLPMIWWARTPGVSTVSALISKAAIKSEGYYVIL